MRAGGALLLHSIAARQLPGDLLGLAISCHLGVPALGRSLEGSFGVSLILFSGVRPRFRADDAADNALRKQQVNISEKILER